MLRAAGILFLAPDKTVLFLKRKGGDHAGEWAFPGGKQEDGESALQCAQREAVEECGPIPDGEPVLLSRRVKADLPDGPEVDFTTFLQPVEARFTVPPHEEHSGYAWAAYDEPPEPLHPGCRIALARLIMDEVDIARAMALGELTSPQVYHNVTLFKIRITGTGVAYRRSLDEYVWRDPSLYLTQDFLDRCNGLPVIMEHPKKNVLDSDEFANRIVGTVVYPFVEGDEVWAIAKIYDAPAIKIMRDKQLSTSPAVIFRDPSVNNTVELEQGEKLLIEGRPSLIDHIAICEHGVWDKGGDPAGVRVDTDPVPDDTGAKLYELRVKAQLADIMLRV